MQNNYAITYASGNIIVNTAALTITANTVTKVYGTTLTGGAGSTAFTSTGLQNGETVGSVSINYGPGSAKTDASGTYTGSSTAGVCNWWHFRCFRFTITYVAGDVVVGGAPLTIKARNKTIRQGSAIPTLTVNYKGFVNGDTQAVNFTANNNNHRHFIITCRRLSNSCQRGRGSKLYDHLCCRHTGYHIPG